MTSIWDNLKKQIFLGDEKFVSEYQKPIDNKTNIEQVPLSQKRVGVHSLIDYLRNYRNRLDAIATTFSSGGYTLKELSTHFNCHYSTISRIIKKAAQLKC